MHAAGKCRSSTCDIGEATCPSQAKVCSCAGRALTLCASSIHTTRVGYTWGCYCACAGVYDYLLQVVGFDDVVAAVKTLNPWKHTYVASWFCCCRGVSRVVVLQCCDDFCSCTARTAWTRKTTAEQLPTWDVFFGATSSQCDTQCSQRCGYVNTTSMRMNDDGDALENFLISADLRAGDGHDGL